MAFDIDFTVCIVLMASLTAIYVIAGGYFATAVNDFIQGIIMLVGIIAVIAVVLADNGGFIAALDALARVEDKGISTTPGIFASFFGPDPLALLGVVILTSLGTWGLPQMVQRFYSIRAESDVFKATVISTLFAIIIAGGCYFLGAFGRLYANVIDIKAGGYDAIIPTMLSGLSSLLIGITVLLVLSASMSTLSALVMTSSATFTLDCLKGHIIKDLDEKRQLAIIRALIALFIVISSVIAIVQYKGGITFIAQLMGISWGALAGSFLAPLFYGLYWKRTSNAAVWCCFVFSTLFMPANILFRDAFPAILKSPINAGAFAMLFGLVIVPVVSVFSKTRDAKSVESCFACYEQTPSAKEGN
jgi:SSS family solute:Na+ symporter